MVLQKGSPGETYNIGGCNAWANIDIVNLVCDRLDKLKPGSKPKEKLITYVKDRPGHDRRYAIDSRKIIDELSWAPSFTLTTGIEQTLHWYLNNQEWCLRVRDGSYTEYYVKQYAI